MQLGEHPKKAAWNVIEPLINSNNLLAQGAALVNWAWLVPLSGLPSLVAQAIDKDGNKLLPFL